MRIVRHFKGLVQSIAAGRGLKNIDTTKVNAAPAGGYPFDTITLCDGHYEYKFVCHNQKEKNRAARLFDKEKGTIAWISQEIRPNDVFYDIGANIGSYTIFAGMRLGAEGRVYCFEPHIPNANSLIQNIFLNGLEKKVRLSTIALTRATGYNDFNYHSMHAAASTSQYGGSSYEGEAFAPRFVEIKHGCTLDALWEARLIPSPDLVKIDVDGLDYDVLLGMRKIMSSTNAPRAIQIEIGTETKAKIMKFCEEAGFVLKIKHWTEAGLKIIEQGGNPEDTVYNAVFYHADQV